MCCAIYRSTRKGRRGVSIAECLVVIASQVYVQINQFADEGPERFVHGRASGEDIREDCCYQQGELQQDQLDHSVLFESSRFRDKSTRSKLSSSF